MIAPLAIDLCCGLGGWTEGLLAEGWRVRGYDIEAHEYGEERYPADLVLRNVLEMHGSELADADLIVASPPCQAYSYMAMPWKLAKAKAAAIRADETGQLLRDLNAIFEACFRLQREASEAAGRYIPMVVENVRGAQPWVGRAVYNFGSYYLWGDVPALMPRPQALEAVKVPGMGAGWVGPDDPRHQRGLAFNPGAQGAAVREKLSRRRNDPGMGARFTSRDCGLEAAGRKIGGDWLSDPTSTCRRHGSKSKARKEASAKIAKIPFALSSHIARVYKPQRREAA